MRSRSFLGGMALGASLFCGVAQSQPTGSEFIVNTKVEGEQDWSSLCTDGTGQVVAVWADQRSTPDGRIRAQRFSVDGQRLGGEWKVDVPLNGQKSSLAHSPAVACSEAGGFVIVWMQTRPSDPQSKKDQAVMGQVYGTQGQRVGGRFVANAPGVDLLVRVKPAVSMDPQGGFVVLWQQGQKEARRIRTWVAARRYGQQGNPLGKPLQISQSPGLGQLSLDENLQISHDGQGRFVVLWTERDNQSRGRVLMRRFAENGKPNGNQVVVFGKSRGVYSGRIVHEAGDGFWLTWTEVFNGRGELRGRRYTAQGTPVGPTVSFNSPGGKAQSDASLTLGPDGQILVVWEDIRVCTRFELDPLHGDIFCAEYDEALEGGEGGIRGRFFDTTGQPQSAEFGINQTIPGRQHSPRATSLGEAGRFLVIWTDQGPEIPCDRESPQPCHPLPSDSIDGDATALVGREVCLGCGR